MKKGRSTYPVQFNTDSNVVDNLMQSYITAENFQIHEKDGEQYFRAGNQMAGYRGLKYSINGQTLTIEAWLDGALGNFPLEQNSMNMMAMNYRNSLNHLFQEIGKLNNEDNNHQQGNPNQNAIQFAETFKNENTKKQETICEIGFWISILGLLGSFLGVVMGLLVYVMDFYFASQGLKTRKRNKAIATIVLSILSILIVIFQLLMV